MKLINKILTGMAPVAMVGVIAPTIASCSCSPATMTINYGDDINCKDKKSEITYHSVDEVKTAVKAHAPIEKRKQIDDIYLGQVNSKWVTEEGKQDVYFDLIASEVWTNSNSIILTGWKVESGILSFTLSGFEPFAGNRLVYQWDDDGSGKQKLWLVYGTNNVKICTSYRFYSCEPAPSK